MGDEIYSHQQPRILESPDHYALPASMFQDSVVGKATDMGLPADLLDNRPIQNNTTYGNSHPSHPTTSFSLKIVASQDFTRLHCHKCLFYGANILDFISHNLKEHAESWNYFCNVCSIGISLVDLTNHAKSHEVNDLIIVENFLNNDFNESDDEPLIKFHESDEECKPIIEKEKLKKKSTTKSIFGCEICKRKFAYKSSYEKHKARHEKTDGETLCHNCGKTFVNRNAYNEHKKRGDCGNFVCPTCNETYTVLKLLRSHFKSSHSGRLVKCNYCTEMLEESNVDTHCQQSHGDKLINSTLLECDFCKKKFRSKVVLQKHVLRHCIQGSDPSFLCMVCGKIFTLESSLKLHLRLHNNDLRYKCAVCGDGFVAKGYLKRHFFKHTGEKQFKCPHCPEGFNHRKPFKKHKELVHQDESQYKCITCGESYESQARFDRHKKVYGENCAPICRYCGIKVPRGILKRHELTHTDTKLFACTLCPKRFTRKENLEQHQNIHTGERPYKCDICGQAFHIYATLFAHKIKHEGKQSKTTSKPVKRLLQCPECTFVGVNKVMLNDHLLKIHDVKTSVELFQCTQCDYSSAKRVNVYAHRRKKHNCKQFDCTYCGKSFSIKFKFIDHMNSHTGATPHACPGCSKSFSSRKNMWQHRDKYCPVVAKRKKGFLL